MGLTHFDEAERAQPQLKHLRATWTYLGDCAGSVTIGVNRIEVADGAWATPAHEHGREEEIFYVLGGRGLFWWGERTFEIRAGDCVVCLPNERAHTMHGVEALDVLAFGTRATDESVGFPRQGRSRVGQRIAETLPGSIDGLPAQWVREAELGPPELSADPAPRPSMIVNVDDVEPRQFGRSRVSSLRSDLGRAAGSLHTGLKYVEVQPGKDAAPAHCHSMEEEIFVVLDGDGVLVLGQEEHAVRGGSVLSRPAGTGVSHMFTAGQRGLRYLAYGRREPGDMCYYPRSNKISFGGLGVIGRLERLDYWDGED